MQEARKLERDDVAELARMIREASTTFARAKQEGRCVCHCGLECHDSLSERGECLTPHCPCLQYRPAPILSESRSREVALAQTVLVAFGGLDVYELGGAQ